MGILALFHGNAIIDLLMQGLIVAAIIMVVYVGLDWMGYKPPEHLVRIITIVVALCFTVWAIRVIWYA